MIRLLQWLVLLVLSATMTRCDKCIESDVQPADQLPPVTQVGANTFGCKINGRIFLPLSNGKVKTAKCLRIEYDPNPGEEYLSIACSNFEQTKLTDFVGLVIDSLPKVIKSTYTVTEKPAPGFGFAPDIRKSGICNNYLGLKGYHRFGKINLLKFDTVNRIASGTFEGIQYTDVCDTIRITEGRFDVKF